MNGFEKCPLNAPIGCHACTQFFKRWTALSIKRMRSLKKYGEARLKVADRSIGARHGLISCSQLVGDGDLPSESRSVGQRSLLLSCSHSLEVL